MKECLLLNTGFEPLRVVSWQRAFILLFQGKVEVLHEYTHSIRTVTREFKLPAVVRLMKWINLKKTPPVIRFSRSNLYVRDEYRCQYCYRRFPEKELTLDHVVPVVRRGKKTWDNIVTACIHCNQKKRDRSPEEAGLRLLKKPQTPRWLPGMVGTIKTHSAPEIWRPYLQSSKNGLGMAATEPTWMPQYSQY